MESKLTLFGMEQYLQSKGDSLFENIQIPENCDKDTLVDSILLSAGEFDTLYPNPYFMKSAISVFFKRKFSVYDKWFYNLSYAKEYNPIENFEQITEEHKDKHTNKKGTESKLTNDLTQTNQNIIETDNTSTQTNDLTETLDTQVKNTVDGDTVTRTTPGTTNTVENKVSAFDSSDFVNKDKTTSVTTGTDIVTLDDDSIHTSKNTGDIKNTGTVTNHLDGYASDNATIKNTGTSTTKLSGQDEIDDEYGKIRTHGCVGVKSSGALLQEDVYFYKKLDLYQMISDEFVSEFCILLY